MKCNRTLHDELRHAVASTPPNTRILVFASVPAPSLRPRHHAMYFLVVMARAGFSKGETDGVLVPIRWTRFCETIFWEKDSQNLGYCFLKFGGILFLVSARRRGLGRNARPPKNTKNIKQKIVSGIVPYLSYGCNVTLAGVHPRHPPRAFPLGLLAPRCLCADSSPRFLGRGSFLSPGRATLVARVRALVFRPRHPHSTLCKLEFSVSLRY